MKPILNPINELDELNSEDLELIAAALTFARECCFVFNDYTCCNFNRGVFSQELTRLIYLFENLGSIKNFEEKFNSSAVTKTKKKKKKS